MLDEHKHTTQQLLDQMTEMTGSNAQVKDELKSVKQFCVDIHRTFKQELGIVVEKQVSQRVAPLQQELAAVKVEMQQMRERMESSPVSTSQQQSQPDVSKLEDNLHKLEQAAVQQAA